MSNLENKESRESANPLAKLTTGAAIAVVVLAATGCKAEESPALNPVIEPTPTLVQETPIISPTTTPTTEPTVEVVEEVDAFIYFTESLEIESREEAGIRYEITYPALGFRFPVTSEKPISLDLSRSVTIEEIPEGVVLKIDEIVTMKDEQGDEVKFGLIEILSSGEKSVTYAVVLEDRDGKVYASEYSEAVVTGVIPNLREYSPEQIESLSQSLKKFEEYQAKGAFKNGARYQFDQIFGSEESEVISILTEMVIRMNKEGSTEGDFISKIDGYMNFSVSGEGDSVWLTLSQGEELLANGSAGLFEHQALFQGVQISEEGMTEETAEIAESILDLLGFQAFLHSEQREQVLEFRAFQEVFNGCDGDAVCFREVDTGNEDMDKAFEILADHAEGGGKLNSIALAFALREAFPDIGFPKLGDEIRGTVMEVFADNSTGDPLGIGAAIDFAESSTIEWGRDHIMVAGTAYKRSYYDGPAEDIYQFLISGDILFPNHEEMLDNLETEKLQVILAVCTTDESKTIIAAEIVGGVMRIYTSKDNEDNLVNEFVHERIIGDEESLLYDDHILTLEEILGTESAKRLDNFYSVE